MNSSRQSEFECLLDQNKGILYKVIRSYCRNAGDQDDLGQEIIVQLWQSFPQFDRRSKFSTWAYRIALNVAISFYRRERIRTHEPLPVAGSLLEPVDSAAAQPVEIGMLYDWIARLDPLNRALLLLYLDGHSYQEIADILGITETNTATKLNQLRKTMKGELGGALNESR